MRACLAIPLVLLFAACEQEATTPQIESAVSLLLFDGSLNRGDAQLFVGGQAGEFNVVADGTSQEFLLVPFNASGDGDGSVQVEVAQTGAANSLIPSRAAAEQAELVRDDAMHMAMLERDRSVLNSLITPASRSLIASGSAGRPVPAEGDIINLNGSLEPCTPRVERPVRVVAVTERAIIVEDQANPSGGFSDAEYRDLGDEFDNLIYAVDTQNFGEPTDIDDNDRVIIFFTRVVNELTPPNSDFYVGGFFFSRDLAPRAQCSGSNGGEIFYMLAPDPAGEVNGNIRLKNFVLDQSAGTIAHEFQHLINSSRRAYINNADQFEDTWLNEGLSHIAEELVFYEASGLEPRQNLDITDFQGNSTRIAALLTYQASNISRYRRYLQNPDEESLLGIDNLETRGATWSFLRFAADLDEGPDRDIWFGLVNGNAAGTANLRNVLQTNPIDLMQAWTTSVFTDDFVNEAPALYQQPSWNFRALMPQLFAAGTFPLEIETLSGGQVSLNLEAGGAAYVRFGVPAGQRATIRVTSGGQIAPSRLRATLIRIE